MTDRIRINPTQQDIDRWVRVFVPTTMMWWWDDSPIPHAEKTSRIVPRDRLSHEPLLNEIVYVNTFHTWAMSKDTTRIIVDDGEWSTSLSEDERRHASSLQVHFNRGLCPPRERFGDASLPASAVANGRVVLDYSLWTSLPADVKRAVIEAELPDWDSDLSYTVPVDTPERIASIANSFVGDEGINCLAVTAFAVTANPADLHQWLRPKAFEEILRNYEYIEIETERPTAGDVIIFRDEEGNVVHAAYALHSDRILNKNGQTSFNPIAITDLSTLEQDWQSYSYFVFRQQLANSPML